MYHLKNELQGTISKTQWKNFTKKNACKAKITLPYPITFECLILNTPVKYVNQISIIVASCIEIQVLVQRFQP
jgi:hypothetical protein